VSIQSEFEDFRKTLHITESAFHALIEDCLERRIESGVRPHLFCWTAHNVTQNRKVRARGGLAIEKHFKYSNLLSVVLFQGS
jgi:hypothetical protein